MVLKADSVPSLKNGAKLEAMAGLAALSNQEMEQFCLTFVEKKKLKKKNSKLATTLLTPTAARLAERAAKALQLEVCTVDVLEGGSGAYVLEVSVWMWTQVTLIE